FCPSRMLCKINENKSVSVNYIKDHNHTCQFKDTEHQHIPPSVKDKIEKWLDLGASVDHIHKDLREGRDARENRKNNNNILKKHAITKRHIREIARKMKLNHREDRKDAESIFYNVQNLQMEPYDPVL
ncbi:unnamed protein product, partial [Meganyctiphanes norvegica]